MTTEQPKGYRTLTASNMQISPGFNARLFYTCGLTIYTYFWTVTPRERTAASAKPIHSCTTMNCHSSSKEAHQSEKIYSEEHCRYHSFPPELARACQQTGRAHSLELRDLLLSPSRVHAQQVWARLSTWRCLLKVAHVSFH